LNVSKTNIPTGKAEARSVMIGWYDSGSSLVPRVIFLAWTDCREENSDVFVIVSPFTGNGVDDLGSGVMPCLVGKRKISILDK